MQTKREEFEEGSSKMEDFWKFVNERHAVWIRRAAGQPQSSWTKDEVLRTSRFTNIFRELDRGTIAHKRMEQRLDSVGGEDRPGLMAFNAVWYRMLNRVEHAGAGPITELQRLKKLVMEANPLFTAAHNVYMPKGVTPGKGVREWYYNVLKGAWKDRDKLASDIMRAGSLQEAFNIVRGRYVGVGPFIAYEIITDLRRTILACAGDSMTWCNINHGGGSARGLRRLGYERSHIGARTLLNDGTRMGLLLPHLAQHLPRSMWSEKTKALGVAPLLELREIEHSLCEFDKYERVRTGLGKTRGGRFKSKPFDDGGFGEGLCVKTVEGTG